MSTPTDSSAPPVAPEQASVWGAIKSSLRGHREDYTRLPLPRAILLLALPMALELVMESTFGVVDLFFVGKLGPEAVATVGLSGSVIILIFAVALGLSIGATAVVSRRIGEGDEEGAAVAAVQAILAGIVFSIPMSIAGVLLAPNLLRWMGGSEDVVAGWGYTAWLFGGSTTIFLLFLNNAIFRGAGDAAIAMRSLWLANLLNMALDPCLIFGLGPFPELGLNGAAIATTIGRGTGVLFQFWVLARGGRRVEVHARHLRYSPEAMRGLLKVSVNGMLQFFVGTASWLGMNWIVARFGDQAIAGFTIAVRLIHFAILPSWGMSNAAATLVGQNLGAKQPDRAEQSVWLTGRYNLIMLMTIAVIFWTFAEPLVRIFSDAPGVIEPGVTAVRVSAFAYCFSAYSMVFSNAFNGAGDTWTPTKINFAVLWIFQLPLAYSLGHVFGWGLTGVLSAMVCAQAIWAVVGGLVFRTGSWKTRTV